MTNQDEPPALSIGAVLGDSDMENMSWKRAINALSKQVQAGRVGVFSPLRLNVVFHVDGKLAPNEFEGVRTGRFSKKDSHLLIQAAVPPGPAEDRGVVLVTLLGAAVDEAEAFARNRRIAKDLQEIRSIVESLSDA